MSRTIPSHLHSTGVNRRELLQVGYSGLMGLELSNVIAGRSAANDASQPAAQRKPKSILIVFLTGAASHHDTFDMKLQAPLESSAQQRQCHRTSIHWLK
jgi:hypothetical protein